MSATLRHEDLMARLRELLHDGQRARVDEAVELANASRDAAALAYVVHHCAALGYHVRLAIQAEEEQAPAPCPRCQGTGRIEVEHVLAGLRSRTVQSCPACGTGQPIEIDLNGSFELTSFGFSFGGRSRGR